MWRVSVYLRNVQMFEGTFVLDDTHISYVEERRNNIFFWSMMVLPTASAVWIYFFMYIDKHFSVSSFCLFVMLLIIIGSIEKILLQFVCVTACLPVGDHVTHKQNKKLELLAWEARARRAPFVWAEYRQTDRHQTLRSPFICIPLSTSSTLISIPW